MADLTIANVGEKLIVGQVDTSFLTASSRLLPGTSVLNGPVYIGMPTQIGVARAACMIGPPISIALPVSLEVTGITNLLGNLNVFGLSTFNGASIFNGVATKNGADISNGVKLNNGSHLTNASKIVNGSLLVNGLCTVTGLFTAAGGITAPSKFFDILHPTKENHRLRHGCLEGPENAVYIRGRLTDGNIINLPDYWTGLVDETTITAHLSSWGLHQELYIQKIENNKIKIVNNSGGKIDCNYIVYATRKDIPSIIVEYEGDYPGESK
jgi:hypothetical protein